MFKNRQALRVWLVVAIVTLGALLASAPAVLADSIPGPW
jgi:hypothetical protein